ncbi:DUF637 domain-containing protein [Variovorax sp. JS1663]|uniref:DUF637 domain-containing protein n=1 Tax=Variovorax sp. JS1663 TaxID=1851577 RepID=UPI000B342A0C|nr:DUF637 domain-containing protein [Variovorax sp. JS1663]OUM03382.1 hypothetical protein A8M77_06955 [Variovorax sp. JS1663]
MQNRASGTGIDVRTDTAAPSTITSSQGGVLLQGGGVVQLQGVQVAAAKDIAIEGGEIYITAATNRSEVSGEQRQRGGDFGPLGLHDLGHGLGAKANDTLDSETTRLARTTLSGANVSITATGPEGKGGDLHIAGTTVNTPGTLSLSAETLYLDTQSTVATLETGSQRKDFAWQQQGSRGTSDETTNYNQFNAAALAVNANRVQAGVGARDSLEQLARQPGMGWIEQLNNDPNLSGKVDWVKVEEAHRNWDYKQQGLTPEGAAIVTLVVNYFTFGAASAAGTAASEAVATSGVLALGEGGFVAAGGLTASSVVGGAVTAGVTALASQASVALVNNRGDIAGALDDLGSSASVKNLLTAIVTGGVLAGLNLDPTGLPTVGGGAQPFMTQLGQNLTAGAARAVIKTAINGGSFEQNLKEGLKNALLDTVAAQGANAIGKLTANGTLDGFTNKVAHAIAGCVVGAARASSASGCAPGALGAAIGEIAAETYGRQADTVQFAAMVSGIAVAVTGGDASQINIGSQAGSNAAANNYLAHPEQIRDPKMQQRILAAGEGCKGPSSCEGVAAQAQAQIDLLSDSKIAAMCSSNTACVADRELERSIYARTRDEAISKFDPNTAAAKFLDEQAGKSPYRPDELSAAVTRMQNGRSDEGNPVDQYVRDTLAGSPPLFAAVLGVSLIDGDGGKSARKGPTPGQRMGDSINAYYAKRTDQAVLEQIDIEHIAQGHINRVGRAVGFHHEPSGEGVARVNSYTKPPDANGVYEGTVQVQNALGQWVDKSRSSTFFPQSWSEARLNYELTIAFNNKAIEPNGQWIGRTYSGIKVQFVPPTASITQWRGWPLR